MIESYIFNKLTNDGVIKELNMFPFNTFTDIFFLLFFQRQLNKDLLQLFITIINHKLFESIFLDKKFDLNEKKSPKVKFTSNISNP